VTAPLVSVVIPTLRRPQLLLRALDGVLHQTMSELEVIVVIDGPDSDTNAALARIIDPRLRVVQNESSLGPGASRNVGVKHSRAAWIAFLDDDDEWFLQKLEHQLATTRGQRLPLIIASRYYALTPWSRFVWPIRIYDNATAFDEYLFDRRSFTKGESLLHLSSLLASRDLFDRCAFRPLRMYEDYAFLLEAVKVAGARIVTIPEALATIHMEERRPSLSQASSWRASLDWIDSVKPLVGSRAYIGFCLTTVGPQAAADGDYRAFSPILRQALSQGAPRMVQLFFYVLAWLLPVDLRRRLRRFLLRSTSVSA
jgi:glycosyltransferase involved in cell wall biosynthesis